MTSTERSGHPQHSMAALQKSLNTHIAALIDEDDGGRPRIDSKASSDAVEIAHHIGEGDGRKPGTDEHVQRFTLPSQGFVSTAIGTAMEELGTVAQNKVAASQSGVDLYIRDAEDARSWWQKAWAGILRHRLLILGILVVAVIEYAVGIRFTQTVLGLDDDSAHVVALALPLMFGLASIAAATGVIAAQPQLARQYIKVSTFLLIGLVLATFVLAGLVIGGVVTDDSGSGAYTGTSGFEAFTTESEGGGPLSIIKFMTYFCFMASLNIVIFLLHLIDKYREDQARTERAAQEAEGGSPAERAARANITYLGQFDELYRNLARIRRNLVEAYISGVRGNIDVNLGENWDTGELKAELPEPEWVGELRSEIRRLDKASSGDTDDSAPLAKYRFNPGVGTS